MSFFRDHDHTSGEGRTFQSATGPASYGAIVGTVDQSTEKDQVGRSGDHLIFNLEIGGGNVYQVAVNTKSNRGTSIGVYIANETLQPQGTGASSPFGPPSYGVVPNASLSYAGLGLTDDEFTPIIAANIESELETALNASVFISVYGLFYTDGTGIHETHYSGRPNQDGAVVVYYQDPTTNAPVRKWFFFKFQEDSIGVPEG